jgi:hypothetical protein
LESGKKIGPATVKFAKNWVLPIVTEPVAFLIRLGDKVVRFQNENARRRNDRRLH